jgi:ribose 5-phosphate isomerase B
MTISIGGDHAGYDLKNTIINYLNENGIQSIDCGPNSKESCDYPDYAHKTVGYLIDGEVDFSILICGSGNGVCMTANKWRTVRAALCWNKELAELSRLHNNANTLCLPARFIEENDALEMVKIFLSTEFEGGRHEKRVSKIAPIL